MKVVHIVGGRLNGGAARGAYWLHKGLLAEGVDSKILLNHYDNLGDNTVYTLPYNKYDKRAAFRYFFEKFLLRFLYNPNDMFSLSILSGRWYDHKVIKEADVINLHWVNGGFFSIKDLHKINQPIVWTIRDMWPVTGGCHYSLSCEKYKNGCNSCPVLNSTHKKDISYFSFKAKKEVVSHKDVTAVGISNWASSVTKSSNIFDSKKVTTIPNIINIDSFKVLDKVNSRYNLSIPNHKKVVLFGAQNVHSKYKGYDLLIEVLEVISNDNEIQLVSFGKIDPAIVEKYNIISFGFVNNPDTLNQIYASSDVFLSTSRYETFGKTIAEAMCTGTPVVAFDFSGPVDIIDHKENGYLAVPYQVDDFISGMYFLLRQNKSIISRARNKVLSSFSPDVISKKYIELYKTVIN